MIQDSLHLRDEEGSYKPFVRSLDVMLCLSANVMMEMLCTKNGAKCGGTGLGIPMRGAKLRYRTR